MIDFIQKKLTDYDAANQVEEAHAIKEILQDIALYGLWRADFFEVAGFQVCTQPWFSGDHGRIRK